MKNEFLLRLKNVWLLPILFLFFMAMSTTGKAQTVTIFTDQDDYLPGESVIITGSGWIPGDQVQLSITHIGDYIPDHSHSPWTLTADVNGNLYDEWPVGDMELGTTMWLKAQSLLYPLMKADKVFTDGNAVSGNGTMTASPAFVCGGGYGLTYTFSFNGGSGNKWNVGSALTIEVPLDYCWIHRHFLKT